MQTVSSARRTCMASESAVECTATVAMPISRQARWMRSAISPRFAIRILSNISLRRAGPLLDDHQDLAVLDGRAVGNEDPAHGPAPGRGDRVHRLHGLDDQDRLALGDPGAPPRRRARRRARAPRRPYPPWATGPPPRGSRSPSARPPRARPPRARAPPARAPRPRRAGGRRARSGRLGSIRSRSAPFHPAARRGPGSGPCRVRRRPPSGPPARRSRRTRRVRRWRPWPRPPARSPARRTRRSGPRRPARCRSGGGTSRA